MKNPYIKLARMAVEKYIKEGKIIEPPKDLPDEFCKERAGVFVSIHKKKEGISHDEQKRILRGCIGTYLPTKENIAKEIISNAISATKDPRSLPIQKDELPYLTYEVYILEEPKLIKSLDELDPKKYGILIKALDFEKSALLLPDLEGIDTIEKQIFVCCQKAGIDPTKEKFVIFKFGAKKYEE
ncbi:MAG: AmmeMemoRadiSam system protein A [Candidatus Pacebacteria bacterium]|nr:AmmeMemoRadiSam system protein A [Candidatus Paceibacterota bacterium]